MIDTITLEQGRLHEAATAAAALHYRPITPPQPVVKPDAEWVKSIGLSTNADAFRGSSPDLQVLLDALLNNFGHDQDLVEDDSADRETNAQVRDNNRGSREANAALRETARQGSDTVRLDESLEDKQLSPSQAREESETRLETADRDVRDADILSLRAQNAVQRAHDGVSEPGRGATRAEGKLARSAEVFEQKAAAAESAARLHRIMVERIRAKAQRQLSEMPSVQLDPAFAQRLRQMNSLLKQRG